MLWSKVNLGMRTGADAAQSYDPTSGEAFAAGFEEGFENGPFKSSKRLLDNLPDELFAGPDADIAAFAREWKPDAVPLETQREIIAEAGLAGKMEGDANWDREMLETMIQARQESEARRFTLDKAGGLAAVSGVAGEMAGFTSDPIALASMFVPVAGEARQLALLGRASGLGGRSLARAGIGAAEGAAGMLMAEPLTLAAQSLGQQDYGPLQSLMNIAGGAVFGAALRPVAGLFSEAKMRNRLLKPWEVVESTEESRAFVAQNARAIRDARLSLDKNLDPHVVEKEALAHAMMLDVYFRNIAASKKISLADIYNTFELDYIGNGSFRGLGEAGRAGKAAGETGEAATQGARALPEDWSVRKADGTLSSAGEILERQRAVIRFFDGADAASPGESLAHYIIRDLREEAGKPGADPVLRDIWTQVEDSLGIAPGGEWTREAADKLAREVENYFWRGRIANENLAPAVEEIRGLLGHAYLDAQQAGYPGNPRAEKAIARVFAMSPEDYGDNFRRAFVGLLDEEPRISPAPLEAAGKPERPPKLEEIEEMAGAHEERLRNAENLDAETRAELEAENAREKAELSDDLAEAEIFEMYAACLAG